MSNPLSVPTPAVGDNTTIFARITIPVEESLQWTPLTAGDVAAVAALPPRSALLIAQGGQGTSERFLLDDDVIDAGRHRKAGIFLNDVTVSRLHAQFVRTDQGYMVKDSGSLNGTYVNRERVDQALLASGDEVQIGKFRMVYQASPAGTTALRVPEI